MAKKKQEEQDGEESEGMSLDDAFGDDEDVEYAESKPKKKKEKVEKKISGGDDFDENIKFKMGKPISELKKCDKVNVDGVEMEIDAHYVLIDHGANKEMTIEMFNPKTDMDFQLRYFDDRVEESAEFFELEEIVYQRKEVKEIEWS